jgi:hypothetical protein
MAVSSSLDVIESLSQTSQKISWETLGVFLQQESEWR